MTSRIDSITAMRDLRSALEMQKETRCDSDFCTAENIDEAISTLSEELESFGINSPVDNGDDLKTPGVLERAFVNLINASWSLVHKHRSLMKANEQMKDAQCRMASDNVNLTNHVKRLKESLDKKQHLLCEVQERERRLKVQSESLSRDLKREKDETIKLKKQSLSKDTQHAHELRRIQQSGHKLREQLQKSAGTYVPKDKVSQKLQADHEKKLRLYEQTIQRLEENNGLMLEEINELRETLALHAGGIELQVEASGMWDDVERQERTSSMEATKEARERASRSALVASILGTEDSRGETDLESSTAAASRQSTKRTFPGPALSKSTLDSGQATSKLRKGRKKKRKIEFTATEEDEETEKTRDSVRREDVAYDEYEEDIERRLSLPKRKLSPHLSALPPERTSTEPISTPISPRVKGKKITKKAMKEQEKNRAAAASAEADKIKNLLIKEMQEEIRLEDLNAQSQGQQDEEEAAKRRVQLENTWYSIYDKKKAFMDYALKNKEEEEWSQYMTCDGLPDPGVLSDLNTFMYLWNLEDDEASMMTVTKKCEVVTYLLARLDNIIDFSIMNSADYIEECKTIRQMFRDKLQYWVDLASYRLLRQIERDMIREDLRNARYIKEANEMICCVWALIRLPVSIKQVNERDRKNIEVSFQEINLTVKMPIDVDCYCMAIRGLWVQYDHYSDRGISFRMPELPDEYQTNMDLLSYCQTEYETKIKIREEQVEGRRLRLEEKKAALDKLMNPPQILPVKSDKKSKPSKKTPPLAVARAKKGEPEVEPEPLPYLPSPDELILMREDESRKEVRKLLFTRCEKTEINLRKYTILGGIYHIDLVFQPPQPKDMRRNIFLTTLQLPKELQFVPFSKPYKAPPPAPDSERTPEVIEAEMKALEAAMEALALVTLKLPETVLWFEPPLVAHWIPERRIWSTQDVHDIKYNEEKQIITFRTGRLGIHGLAGFRFVNLPYQSWELKPEVGKNLKSTRGVMLSITAAIVQAEFIVREDLVCLHTLIGGTTTALQDLVGQYMKLHLLIRVSWQSTLLPVAACNQSIGLLVFRVKLEQSARFYMEGGCDLFPERDAFSYVKGLPVKHTVTEKHLQACMGLLSPAYSFSWSRWNAVVTPRQIVIQSKELHGCVAKEQTNRTLLVTPSQTTAIQCTEVSTEFSDKPPEGEVAKFFADVYHLALHTAGIKSRLLMKYVSFKLAVTVTSLLEATNVISMSS